MPGVSSSSTAASKVADRPLYSLVVAVRDRWPTSTDSSAPSRSCAAVSVTVWAVFQLLVVNVSVDVPTVTAPVSGLRIVTVASCVGRVARRTE